MGTTKSNIIQFNLHDLEEQLLNGKIKLLSEYETETRCVDDLRGKDLLMFEKAKNFIEDVCSLCSNNWTWLLDCHSKSFFISKLSQMFQMADCTVRRYIRLYLQGGMKIQALITHFYKCGGAGKQRSFNDKKAGKPGKSKVARNKNIIEIFRKMYARLLRSKSKITFTKLYEDMVGEYFSYQKMINGTMILVPHPISHRPTYRQLCYWLQQNSELGELLTARLGKAAVRNDFRPLFSDTIDHLNVKSIGAKYEMDEMETDFYLVSRSNRNKVIGRAILYFVIDVYSHSIVGCGTGLDNNSWSGAEMALLNMVENKVEYCKRYGIQIEEAEWPMKGVLPHSVMVDNGAEYLSEQFANLTTELGISIAFAPPRMGSYKPNVEQKFRQMNSLLNSRLPGQIEKDKYGTSYIKGARMDIDQFTKCVIRFILNYNNTPMDNYPETKEMYESGMELTPVNIWNYCLDKHNALMVVNDFEQYKFNLLSKGKAKITRSV